jgi:threonine dehydrogenase-like Zn-dependent dehydrogenase
MKDTVAALLGEHKLKTNGFITHEFPFSQIKEAYRTIRFHPEDPIKVVIRYPLD